MFDQLFTRPTVVARHRAAPLAKERRDYLDYLASQGLSRSCIKQTAAYLLVITRMLRLGERPGIIISIDEIEEAAKRWANRREKRKNQQPGYSSTKSFLSVATHWLEFIARFERRPDRVGRFDSWIAEFDAYMLRERGLSDVTRRGRRWSINHCLSQLDTGVSLTDVNITDLDSLLQSLGEQRGYSRATLQKFAGDLRAFFRFGETRGWCRKGLADAINSPRVYSLASLPVGPSWKDVKRLLALTEGGGRKNIRDRAIIMLLAMYGLRAGEVTRLRLEDFDWESELLSVRSSKTLTCRAYPLSRPVGDAVLRYITQVRPRTRHREVFLSMGGPIQPLTVLWPIVGNRLRRLGVTTTHHGPHSLRHACATHLLAEGLSLKHIGDHLGHSDPDATRIYAKVDIAGLRQVADMDLEELL
jgi:site-specific recombinase XerD